MDSKNLNELTKMGQDAANMVANLLEGIHNYEKMLTPEQQQELEELKKNQPNIKEAADKIKDLGIDFTKWRL